jgi:hypothetical protein
MVIKVKFQMGSTHSIELLISNEGTDVTIVSLVKLSKKLISLLRN